MTTQTSGDVVPEVRELSREEGNTLFDKTTRKLLGFSGAEFLTRWDRGAFEESDDLAITKVAMLIPFAR